MEKSTALLILGLNEDQLNIEEIYKAYEEAKGQFSEELLSDARDCLIKEFNYNNEKEVRSEIRELTKTLDDLKKEMEDISEQFYTLKTNYETYKKDSKKPRSVFIDKNTRRNQIADYIKILYSNADALLNEITLPDTPKDRFNELKQRRNAILSVIKKYENELDALDYIIKKEKNEEFPEPLNIVSEQALEETKEEVKEDIKNDEEIHEVFPQEEEKEINEELQPEENIDFNWNFDENIEPQNVGEEVLNSQPIDENKEMESKGDYTWTFDQEQNKNEEENIESIKQEQPINTDTPNDIDDYTYEEGPVEDKPTVLRSTGYIITKSYQNNIKNDKNHYTLQKDNNKIKTKPFSFISKLKEKINKTKMNKKVSSIINVLKEKSTELYNDYLKIEKIKEVIDSLGDGSIQKQAYENLIESIYAGKQNKIDYLEYAASALDEFANTNPNIKEDTQRMIAYGLPNELNGFNVDDAIVENTYQGSLENTNYTNDVAAFDEFIKNINNIKRVNTNEQQKTL